MKRLCVAAGVLMLAAAAAGQVREPQRFDSAPIVQGLQNPGTREQTAAQLATVPANALAPLAEAAADDSTPSAARDALNAALPRMYERLRTERHKQDQTLDDAWTQRQLLEAYKNGPAGGKAMAEVEPALRSIATGRADYTVLKAAVDAETAAGVKPDDPAIHVAYVLAGLTSHEMALDRVVRQLDPALAALDTSAYSDGVKFLLHSRTLACMNSTDWPADITFKTTPDAEDARLLALLPTWGAEHPGQTRLERELMNAAAAIAHTVKDEAAFDQLTSALESAARGSAADGAIAAAYEVSAWNARGGGAGDSVSDTAFKLFNERLSKGRDAAEAAWREDPLDSDCCDIMIQICRDLELGDDAMELWFNRAMLADPDNAQACADKAIYLGPQWNDESEKAAAFGQECLQRGTARNRISLVTVDIYENLAATTADPNAFFHNPEVWKVIQAAYAVVLSDASRMMDDRRLLLADRGALLKYAFHCGQWQAFLDMAKEYGEDVNVVALGGRDRYDFEKQLAQQQLTAK